MLIRQYKTVAFECDSCDNVVQGDSDDSFEVVWKAAKDQGWTTRKVAGEWLHGCATCGEPT